MVGVGSRRISEAAIKVNNLDDQDREKPDGGEDEDSRNNLERNPRRPDKSHSRAVGQRR